MTTASSGPAVRVRLVPQPGRSPARVSKVLALQEWSCLALPVGCSRTRGPAQQAARPALANDGEHQRAHHEQRRQNRRRFRQHRRAAARAECRLTAAATERARHVAALALLEQDDQQQQRQTSTYSVVTK